MWCFFGLPLLSQRADCLKPGGGRTRADRADGKICLGSQVLGDQLNIGSKKSIVVVCFGPSEWLCLFLSNITGIDNRTIVLFVYRRMVVKSELSRGLMRWEKPNLICRRLEAVATGFTYPASQPLIGGVGVVGVQRVFAVKKLLPSQLF